MPNWPSATRGALIHQVARKDSEIAMATDTETLSIVQFLRLTDRDGISQSQLVTHNSSIFFLPEAEHSTTRLLAWRSQGLISDGEKLGESAIGIALYQGPMGTFLDLTNLCTHMTRL